MDPTTDLLAAGAAIGRQQAFAVIAAKCSAAQALTIRQVKESGCYEELGLRWQEFCPQYFGISQVTADRIVRQLTELGEAYFRLGQLARISEAEFKEIASKVTSETIEFEGERIPLTPENAPRIREVVRLLRAQLRQAESSFRPPSDTICFLQTRLDALLTRMRHLERSPLPAMEKAGLRGLAHYAVEQWTTILRAYEAKVP